ncbi:hypothetical protein Terro_4267 [Terriglobus roseus DSM 18391]|uniref:Uncharacterized protein n=1 Tax=Terriglobus roseus (strain DSM 18391 / NRRL B-41598 / KBS 63) TaxID=926566 RepID=I3ZMK2_TERRK|nr:hypothetical protein Terro_4267 [Terriglobus roseus DSM 18391]
MFGAEPQERWTREEQAEFERYAAERLKACKSSATKAGIALLVNVAIIVPFSAGHRFHSHWQQARFLIVTAELLLVWFGIKVGYVWSSWQSSREVRREYEGSAWINLQADYIRAHKHCIENRVEVEASALCGCFYCMSIYPPSEIVDWIYDREALTADCPRCGIDAVIGSASGFPITPEFLSTMNEHWFEGQRPN